MRYKIYINCFSGTPYKQNIGTYFTQTAQWEVFLAAAGTYEVPSHMDLLRGLSIDVVDCCLKERIKAVEHVVVVEPEDIMSLEQLIKGCHSCLAFAGDRFVIQDDVEPVIEITITKIEDLKSSHSSQDFMCKVPQHVNRGN